MGCITSSTTKTKLNNDNVFRVKVVRLESEDSGEGSPTLLTGYLELNTRELIFYAPGREPVVWALQHLRRYGLNGDLFSFEAGRRCMSGPGIYMFRCQQAEQLYPLFQRYILMNTVNNQTTDTSATTTATTITERERHNSAAHILQVTNNYLEPAPLAQIGSNATLGFRASLFSETRSTVGSPLSLDSPDSLPSLQQAQSPNTPNVLGNTYANTNLYFDQPLRALQEHNNNIGSGGTGTVSGNGSAFSTLTRRTLLRGCSLDVPPMETAPPLCNTYANIDTPGACSLRERLLFDNVERCYENVNRLDLPLLLQPPPPPRESNATAATTMNTTSHQQQQQQQPATPTSIISGSGICGGATTPTSNNPINYIVLDLDQPRSPTQCSPKTKTYNFGSGLSLTEDLAKSTCSVKSNNEPQQPNTIQPMLTVSTPTTTTTTPTATLEQHKSESSLGYSTIDFIKTCALIKSTTTHGVDFTAGQRSRDTEELRLTRHSKCVRKSFSVSE